MCPWRSSRTLVSPTGRASSWPPPRRPPPSSCAPSRGLSATAAPAPPPELYQLVAAALVVVIGVLATGGVGPRAARAGGRRVVASIGSYRRRAGAGALVAAVRGRGRDRRGSGCARRHRLCRLLMRLPSVIVRHGRATSAARVCRRRIRNDRGVLRRRSAVRIVVG